MTGLQMLGPQPKRCGGQLEGPQGGLGATRGSFKVRIRGGTYAGGDEIDGSGPVPPACASTRSSSSFFKVCPSCPRDLPCAAYASPVELQ